MKRRIGTKLYDTDKAIPVLPEQGLYKQPNKRTFFLYIGNTITPIEYETAADMIAQAENPDLLQYLEVKPNSRGCASQMISIEKYNKLAKYAQMVGKSQKSIIEDFIDSLSIE